MSTNISRSELAKKMNSLADFKLHAAEFDLAIPPERYWRLRTMQGYAAGTKK